MFDREEGVARLPQRDEKRGIIKRLTDTAWREENEFSSFKAILLDNWNIGFVNGLLLYDVLRPML